MQADYVLDYDVISTARSHHLYLLARIKGGPPPDGNRRPPLNLSVVLDRSGSMSGDKIEYVKRAAQFLVQHLNARDVLSLVTYDSFISVDVKPGAVVYKDRINQIIQSIKPGSSTNLSGGWLQGCQLVAEGMVEGQVNRVLLLTDGLANEGITDPARLAALARQKREEGITTTTMGVGMGFNEDLLTTMAREGGGAFYFIDNPDVAPNIFREELNDLLSVVGQNLNITLSTSTDVQMVRQYTTYVTEMRGGDVHFRMGDLFADEVKILLLELSIPALKALGQVEVARLRFEYDELGVDSVIHRITDLPIIVNTVPDSEYNVHKPNDEVMRTLLLLRAARAREDAVKHADKGRFNEASSILSSVADEIENSHFKDDAELQMQHDMLREEAIDMEMGAQRYDDYTRKSHSTKVAYFSQTRSVRSSEANSLHKRMKESRRALERKGQTPNALKWRGQLLTLGASCIRIGRAEDNDIVIEEEEVSKYHCQLVREGDSLYLEDLGSTNGTFANGGRVATRFRLSVGDVMTVGSVFFTFLA